MLISRILVVLLVQLAAQAQRRAPPREYPFLSHIPKTTFDCKKHFVGYFADPDPATRCQVYHMCDMKGNKFSYLCPNGTLFHQQLLICAHWYQVNCTKTQQLYEVNKIMFPYEKFKPDPHDRFHKHDRTAFSIIAKQSHLILEESSTFTNFPINRRTFPPFHLVRPSSTSNRHTTTTVAPNVELQAQHTVVVETVTSAPVHTAAPEASTTDLTTPSDLTSTWFESTQSDESDVSTSTTDSTLFESTPWWSQFGAHDPEPPSVAAPPQPSTQIPAKDSVFMKFPKLGSSNLLSDLPINEQCPLCSPLFVQDGHCSPCVVIR